MDKNIANIFVIAEEVMAESEKEIVLYDRFNSLVSKIFKTLTGVEYRPELTRRYSKPAQAFLDSARQLFDANPSLTDVTGASDPLQLIEYSEKAIAVIGDTKNAKEKFKIDGRYVGRFNKNLNVKGESVAGWIFPKKHRDFLQKTVTDYNAFNTPIRKTFGEVKARSTSPEQKPLFVNKQSITS